MDLEIDSAFTDKITNLSFGGVAYSSGLDGLDSCHL